MLESHAEDIIKIINHEKKRQELEQNDINRGYAEIFYDTVVFERKILCNGAFSMMMPAFFDVMKEEFVALKWDVENRPEFIYTNETFDINITVSFCSSEQIGKDILEIQKEMEKNIKQISKEIVLIENEILKTKEGLMILHFSFPLYIEQQSILEELFLFLIYDKWAVATFHCPYAQKRDWLTIVKQMILSIQLEQ